MLVYKIIQYLHEARHHVKHAGDSPSFQLRTAVAAVTAFSCMQGTMSRILVYRKA